MRVIRVKGGEGGRTGQRLRGQDETVKNEDKLTQQTDPYNQLLLTQGNASCSVVS